MPTKDSDATSHDTEHAILQAAEKEFLTKGFAGARTTSIAAAAGVTHAMLHYYFRTKERLYDRIVADKIALLREVIAAPFDDASLSLPELMRAIVERHIDFIAANPDLPRFLIGEVYSGTERSKVFVEQLSRYAPPILDALQAKIDCAADAGECRRLDARMLMIDIASLNIFSFMTAPLIDAVLGIGSDAREAFIARRKEENIDTIMRKLL